MRLSPFSVEQLEQVGARGPRGGAGRTGRRGGRPADLSCSSFVRSFARLFVCFYRAAFVFGAQALLADEAWEGLIAELHIALLTAVLKDCGRPGDVLRHVHSRLGPFPLRPSCVGPSHLGRFPLGPIPS